MPHGVVLGTFQTPCKAGCPSGVRGGVYVVCAAPGRGASATIAGTARVIIDLTSGRLTGNLLSYLISNSTSSSRVLPVLRTARVTPASCQKNSPVFGLI